MIISGKELSAQLKTEMAAQVAEFPEKYGRVPHLVVILVGDNPASVSYVTGKAKASELVESEIRPYVSLRRFPRRNFLTLSVTSMRMTLSTESLSSFLSRSI